MNNKKYKTLDLFAGCGGISQGFEKNGFEITVANEFWEPAGKTFVKNHPKTIFFGDDITHDETKQKIYKAFGNEQCDVIVGGPPCQAYSVAGSRNPNDPRGRLFEDYVEIVKHLRPKVFVMENVKGLITIKHDKDNLSEDEKAEFELYHNLEQEKRELLLLRKQSKNNSEKFKFGINEEDRLNKVNLELKEHHKNVLKYRENVTDKIIRRFNELGYNLKFKVLNSADYGAPQKRERVIFIGTRYDIPIKFPKPTHSQNGENGLKKWVSVKDAIDDLKHNVEDISFNHIITEHTPEFHQKIKNTPLGKSVFGNYSDAFYRNPPNEPSRTVKENHGGVLVHYEKNRVMTPRELARLQTFDDNFKFMGSKSQILVQIGNAVPVKLAEAVSGAVKNMLIEIEKIEKKN